jgi:hypothetical protein
MQVSKEGHHLKKALIGALACAAAMSMTGTALAATEVVTPSSSSWANMDTRPGGATAFTEEYGAPAGLGAASLKLTTDATSTAKADYWTSEHVGTPLSDVTSLSYFTYQDEGPPHAGVSYQIQIDVDGTIGGGGFTTLVYEPYQNGVIVPEQWQQWDVDAGQFWSTRTVGGLVAGGGGAPFYTLAAVTALNPDAVVLGIGVNIGSNNPGYVVATDGVQFNDTTYDFELHPAPPTSADQCKQGGWQTFTGQSFKNQGDCVSFVANGKA